MTSCCTLMELRLLSVLRPLPPSSVCFSRNVSEACVHLVAESGHCSAGLGAFDLRPPFDGLSPSVLVLLLAQDTAHAKWRLSPSREHRYRGAATYTAFHLNPLYYCWS